MSNHTPGPWVAEENTILQDHSADRFTCKSHLYLGSVDSRADASRIVACVNAMEGIDDPAAARVFLDQLLSSTMKTTKLADPAQDGIDALHEENVAKIAHTVGEKK